MHVSLCYMGYMLLYVDERVCENEKIYKRRKKCLKFHYTIFCKYAMFSLSHSYFFKSYCH